jgi:hypothetical protein
MKKLIFFIVLLIAINSDAQLIYSLKAEPFGLNNAEGKIKTFPLLNFQFSIKGKTDSIFFYEVQSGIIANGPMLHLDLYLGGGNSFIYLKVGIVYLISATGGGMSGPSTDSFFLPEVSLGFFVKRNIFIEVNYLFAYTSIGFGVIL